MPWTARLKGWKIASKRTPPIAPVVPAIAIAGGPPGSASPPLITAKLPAAIAISEGLASQGSSLIPATSRLFTSSLHASYCGGFLTSSASPNSKNAVSAIRLNSRDLSYLDLVSPLAGLAYIPVAKP